MARRLIAGAAGTLLCLCVINVLADEPPPEADSSDAGAVSEARPFTDEQIEFFERQVRPLLADRCFECHSDRSEKLQGGLRLDNRDAALHGGDTGAAFVPGEPDKSLLVEAVRWQSLEMPPKNKLAPREIDVLVKWVELGAPWPASKNPHSPDGEPSNRTAVGDYDFERLRREHWAFAPVVEPAPPDVRDIAWPKNDLDRFVLARLEAAGLRPAPAASPHELLRRLQFDLIGLPPTPEELDRFVAAVEADRDAAVRDVVERLLASPHYGERWGRHWLDVARYSDGQGGFLDSAPFPAAWRFRDWVVAALNDDMPFADFIRSQVAGDLLEGIDGAAATGFFALGPTYKSDGGDPESVAQAEAATLADRVDTLGRGMLGLTLACAQCHEHKFDPVPQQDYYSLAGVFRNTQVRDTPLVPAEAVAAFDQRQQAIGELDKRIKQREKEIKDAEASDAKDAGQASDSDSNEASDLAALRAELDSWREELEELKRTAPPKYPVAHTLADTGSADMKVAIRGDLRKPGEDAPRRFLRILSNGEPPTFTQGSGRVELAEALVDASNPLTARVFVNRIWMQHFGDGLVRTPSNFGQLGESPTHPELLDWLASRFVASGGSMKELHRTIVLSSTYQMSSRHDDEAFRRDGDNRLVWRMNPRRLDVEAWRDALLSVTGELDLSTGGEPTDQVESPRRSLYLKVSRNGDQFATDEFLRLFDFPLMRASVERRETSIVPQQFLFLMNSPFMARRAAALADRLANQAEGDRERIEFAYRLLYSRPPTDTERVIGAAYLGAAAEGEGDRAERWRQYAQTLLSANEFLFVR